MKAYLIDSENVGADWVILLETSEPDDDIVVFYTAKSPYMSYKNLIALRESTREITFIECCEGTNALDFQLCTELGYRICLRPECEYIIISNDTGYDAAVSYWRQRSVVIRRIKGATLRDRAEKQASAAKNTTQVPETTAFPDEQSDKSMFITPVANAVPEESKSSANIPDELPVVTKSEKQPAETKKTAKKKPARQKKPDVQVTTSAAEISSGVTEHVATKKIAVPVEPDAQAREILYIVGKSDLQVLNESLKQVFGEEKGNMYYGTFKSPTGFSKFLNEHKTMSLADKLKLYCGIVFSAGGGETELPDDFSDFVLTAWRKKKNLNSYRAALLEKYGKEKSEKYYSLTRSHVKILDKIK